MLRDVCGWTKPICSFEPVPENFSALEAAMRDDTVWKGYPWALGDETGDVRMAHFPGSSMFDSMLPPSELGLERFPQMATWQDETVPVHRLDQVLDDVLGPEPGAIHLKVDTQGFDHHVLAGAEGCIDRIKSLQLELAAIPIYDGVPPMGEMLQRCDALGFDIAGLFPISRAHDGLRVLEFDGLFVRRASSDSPRAR
jgi:FkbM family methyltransferase